MMYVTAPTGWIPRWSVFLVALLLGLYCQSAFAQGATEGRVIGRVITAATGEGLAGATVGLPKSDQPHGTTTDEDGRFTLTGLSPGPVTLQIRHLGYVSQTRSVQVQAGETTRLTVELTTTALELAGLEITGNTQEALPGAVSMLTPVDLEQMAPLGTQEALTHVPGVYGVADDGMGTSRASVGIRGVSPRRTQRVLVLEDGMPIQPAPYVFSPLYYNPPSERIEEIEVIKGSASIRHGPQTMAGVVNYLTSRPRRQSLGGTFSLTSGTNRFLSAFGEVGGFGGETLRPQVQMLVKRGDGFRENNGFYQLNGTAKLHYLPDANRSLYVKANVDYEHLNATYTGLTPHSFSQNPTFNPKDEDFYRIFRASLGAVYSRRYSDTFEATTKLYANIFDRPWWRERDVYVRADAYASEGTSADPVPWYTNGDLVRIGGGQQYFGNLRTFYVGGVEHSFDVEHQLFGLGAALNVGGRAHWERFRDDRKISDEIGRREGVFYRGNPDEPETLNIVGQSHTYETTALALYALEDLQWGHLRLSPGVRLEVFEQERIDRLQGSTYRDETSFVVLPGVGFNYDLGGGVGTQFHLFGGVHRGYTPPSSATLKIVGFGPALASNEDDEGLDLRSEKSWNSELGVRGRGEIGRFEATGFHLYIEDLVGGRTVFQNLGVVQTYGLELEGTLEGNTVYAPLPALNVSYSLLQTEVLEGRIPSALQAGTQVDITGNELPYSPRHAATVGLTKSIAGTGLSVRTDLRYEGRAYTDLENIETPSNRGDRGPVPAHAVLDASASYAVSDALRLQLVVKNVTDNVYIGSRLHSNPRQPEAHLSSGILPGPRRQINLSLRYNF